MNPSRLFIPLLLLLFLPGSAMAADVNVTFSDLNLYPSQEFSLYQVTESGSQYLGTYNTTDTVSLNSDYEYNIVLKPGPLSWFDNPLDNFDLIWNNAPKSLNFAAFFLLIVGVPLLVIRFLWWVMT